MLKKKINLWAGVAIAVSMVVGSGLFGLPGMVAKETTPLAAFIGWLLVIAFMPTLIYIFTWLGKRYTSAEGVSLYASIGFGGWSRPGLMLVTCGTLIVGMPAFFLIGGSYIAVLLNLDTKHWEVPCALILAIGTTLVNLVGVEKIVALNKFVIILLVCVIGYISLDSLLEIKNVSGWISFHQINQVPITDIWLAMSVIFWAFQGWENMTFTLEEVENPRVNIPLIYGISYLVVSLIYVIFALAIFISSLDGKNITGLSGISNMLPYGIWGKAILAILVFILCANANSWVLGSSRAFYAAAALGVLPRRLGIVNKKGTPVIALWVALLVYLCLMICIWKFEIEEKYVFLLTTQGFIVLYGGSVIAFIRKSKGFLNRLIALVAMIVWGFLMQGFGWMILYPLILLILGSFYHNQLVKSFRFIEG